MATPQERVINTALSEIGYLEKKSNSNLYSKTSNAGYNNYTKYWADIAPAYQAQPWCACFVTWVLTKTFDKDTAKRLLWHFPYISCVQGKYYAKQQGCYTSNPSVGDVIIFKDSSGTPCHTGIVSEVTDTKVTTIEGNTSSGSKVIANGGAVCKKSYSRSYSRIDGYWHLNYSFIEGDDLTMSQYTDLKKEIDTLTSSINSIKSELSSRIGYYNYIDKNMSDSYKPTIQKLVNKGLLQGNESGELMLTTDMMRVLTILDRAGSFDTD